MKIVATVIAALGLLLTTSSLPPASVGNVQSPAPSLTKEQWRQDLQFLAKESVRTRVDHLHSHRRDFVRREGGTLVQHRQGLMWSSPAAEVRRY